MEKRNKKILIILFSLGIVLLTLGVSVAFFNYTRTGGANTVRVGRISFNATQNGTINLSNVFPITSTEAETDTNNSDTVSLRIVGDTDYDKGIEYLVSLDDVNITVNNKKVPINLEVSVSGNGLGTEETGDYYTNRESYTESKYKKEIGNNLNNGSHVIVGYISKNETLGTASGIDGTINIKAYIDADRIAISDTYDGTESSDMGTTFEWVNGRSVFTTSEWNNLNLSFKIKVEANEGIWVEKETTPASCFESSIVYIRNSELNVNTCVSTLTQIWGNEEDNVNSGETYEAFCDGTGTRYGSTFQEMINNDMFDSSQIDILLNGNIIVNNGLKIVGYDKMCGSDVVIPSKMIHEDVRYIRNPDMDINTCNEKIAEQFGKNKKYFRNPDMDINTCVNALKQNWNFSQETNENLQQFCSGTGIIHGGTFQQWLDNEVEGYYFFDNDLESMEAAEILTSTNIGYNDFCNGTGKIWEQTFQEMLDNNGFLYEELNDFERSGIITKNVIKSTEADVKIIEKISGYNLTSVVIPNSVTTIEDQAFARNYLTDVVIGNSVTTIGGYAFRANQLTNVTIPNSVTYIGSSAFEGNNISTVLLGNHVQTIGSSAFGGGTATTNNMPGSCYGDWCIGQGNHIQEVLIPASVNSMSCSAFEENENIQITYENPNFTCSNN